jgi:hypothetical protein
MLNANGRQSNVMGISVGKSNESRRFVLHMLTTDPSICEEPESIRLRIVSYLGNLDLIDHCIRLPVLLPADKPGHGTETINEVQPGIKVLISSLF